MHLNRKQVDTGPIASLRDVWKAYKGEEYILKGIDLGIGHGDFLCILGPSGAGKSTLLRIIGLLDRPSRGEVEVFGRNVAELSDDEAARIRLERIGYIFQSIDLIPHITIRENIEVPMYLRGVRGAERRARALELLDRFGLRHLADRYPHEVSLGEQQRVAAMRALANGPSLIIADEPVAHLDEENAQLLFELLKTLNREDSVSIVMATTSEEEAGVADRVYLLRRGRLSLGYQV
ncbi:MAG: hypothetical protein DRO00_07095 [Thermoproteota archaeon]|nr:MAG: hypothetical protein DRO00_07095 [Candidatus Korarchaeota archaeon]